MYKKFVLWNTLCFVVFVVNVNVVYFLKGWCAMKWEIVRRCFFGIVGLVMVCLFVRLAVAGRVFANKFIMDGATNLFWITTGVSFIFMGVYGARNLASGVIGILVQVPFVVFGYVMMVVEIMSDDGFWVRGITMMHLVGIAIAMGVIVFIIWWARYCLQTIFGNIER